MRHDRISSEAILLCGKFEDVVQFNGTPRELAGQSGMHGHLVSMRLRADHLQNVSVFRVRRLFPFRIASRPR